VINLEYLLTYVLKYYIIKYLTAKLSRKMGLKDNLSNSGLFNVHPKSASGGKEERKIASAKSYK